MRLSTANGESVNISMTTACREPEIIEAFEKALPDYDAVIEFNGDKFDFPFVEKRMGRFK